VDSVTTLLSLLDNLISLAVDPPSLYLDLEGVKLGCHGFISTILLYIALIKIIYLIDIHYRKCRCVVEYSALNNLILLSK
jgi:exonuclease 3'-5' domain-containing protein 1